MEQQYNQKNPGKFPFLFRHFRLSSFYITYLAVKRLMREACELKDATEEYHARPLEDNLFEWHFTVHGSPGSDFDGGVYHGRILLPPEYPMKPPNIILLTPNGRFETNKKICLSISGHHPETWQPSWSIRTAMLALIAFMSTSGRGSIGALDYTTEERKALAEKSQTWSCEVCGLVKDLLSASASSPTTLHEKELLQRITLKPEDASDKTESNVPTENIEPSNISNPIESNQSNDDSSFDQEVEEPIQINPSIVSESQSGLLTDMAFAMLVCGIAFLIFRRFILALL